MSAIVRGQARENIELGKIPWHKHQMSIEPAVQSNCSCQHCSPVDKSYHFIWLIGLADHGEGECKKYEYCSFKYRTVWYMKAKQKSVIWHQVRKMH